jgi:regulator of sigma E protease
VSSFTGFLLVLLGFGFLIFIHELGHFLAAKWAGIRADGFAIGMGPCVASYRRGVGFCLGSADARVVRKHGRRPIEMSDAERESFGLGETEYSFRALPLGGYVRMLGQEDGNPGATSEDARSFGKAPIFRRGVVILAGITANLALAIVLFLVAFLVGVRFPAPAVGFVQPDSSAARADPIPAPGTSVKVGLQPGDRIVSIDGDPVATFIDVRVAAAMAKPDEPLNLVIERGNQLIAFVATPEKDPSTGLLSLGVTPSRSLTLTDVAASRDVVVRALARVSPKLAEAGVGPGATLVAIDGEPVTNFANAVEVTRAKLASHDAAALALEFESPTSQGSSDSQAAALSTRNRVTVLITPEPNLDFIASEARPKQENGEAPSTDFVPAVDAGIAGFVPLARIDGVVPESLNAAALREGDVFLRVGSTYGPRTSELMRTFRAAPNATLPALLWRDGAEVAVDVRTDAKGRVGIYLGPAVDLPLLARAIPARFDADGNATDTAAKSVQSMPLATVLSIDGAPVANFAELRRQIGAIAHAAKEGESREIVLAFRDPSPEATPNTVRTTLTAEDLAGIRSLGAEFPIPEVLFDPEWTVLTANGDPLKAIAMGFRQTVTMVEQVFLTIDRVSRGSVGVDQLQGPVGILHTGTQVASEGFMFMLFFLALISVNLAVVNLLPIPIADGGLFLFLLYEKFRGRPPSIAFQNAAAMAGIALVAGLFLLTFYNDLARLFG